MKKNSTLMLLLGMFMCLAVTATLPDIVSLPHTFNTSSTNGSIDIDDNEVIDFYIYFNYTSYSGIIDYSCYIDAAASGNKVLIEVEEDASPLVGTIPLTDYSPSAWVNILAYGTSIGSVPPVSSLWSNGNIISWKFANPVSPPPPTASFIESPNGYIGVQYYSSGDLYYAWISVSVDNDEPSVTLGGTVSAPMPNTPILAGSGSGVVPVPLIASIIGFMAIGSGAWLRIRRKRKK